MIRWREIFRVFLPFTAGFYLSCLFRTINALISSQIAAELKLGASEIGLLTSVYFLTFAAIQLPLGIWLDRYGPRPVQSALMVVASVGAALFSCADRFYLLVIARALIGFGAAGALAAGLKAIVLWFPKERLALACGWFVMLGALGAVTATGPAEVVLTWTDWRGLFSLLAVATAGCALVIHLVVPEADRADRSVEGSSIVGFRTIFANQRFRRLAPLSAVSIGTAWSLQSLWVVPWLVDVEGLGRPAVVRHLFVMAVSLSVGGLLIGVIVDRMYRREIDLQRLLRLSTIIFIAAQSALIMRLGASSYAPWVIIAAAGATTILGYASLLEQFPNECSGRANAALNVFHIGGAFVLQWSTGLIVQLWPNHIGHYPAVAYQTAFGFNILLQIAALAWFTYPWQLSILKRGVRRLTSHLFVTDDTTFATATPYQSAAQVWDERLGTISLQAANWRRAAVGSVLVSSLLSLAFGSREGASIVARYIVEVDRLPQVHAMGPPLETETPSDSQITHFVARFVENIRSLSIDPIVVRAHWTQVYDYVTDHEARILAEYTRNTDAFTQLGEKSITVEVISVVRAAANSFEIRWVESTYRRGTLMKVERFIGVAAVIFKMPTTADILRSNPLGLYVDTFKWSADPIEEGGK